MKKVLSIILAIIMLASVMPVAFAAEDCEHEFNTETLIRPSVVDGVYQAGSFVCDLCGQIVETGFADMTEFYKAYGYIEARSNGAYFDDETFYAMYNYANQLFEEAIASGSISLDFSTLTSYEQDILDGYVEVLKEIGAKLEAYAVENGYNRAFETTDVIAQVYRIELLESFYGYNFKEFLENEADKVKLDEITAVWLRYEIIVRNLEDPHDITAEQVAEIEEVLGEVAIYLERILDCMEGKHTVEVASDCTDGTHIGDCAYCDETAVTGEHIWDESAEECICCGAENKADDDVKEEDSNITDKEEEVEAETAFENLPMAKKLEIIIADLVALITSFIEFFLA